MAVTTQNSTQYGYIVADPPTIMNGDDYLSKVRYFEVDFTQSGAGDANSLVNLFKLPAGRWKLLRGGILDHSDWGSSVTFDIGYLAHTNSDGTAVAASIDGITNGVDLNNTTAFEPGAAISGAVLAFDSQEGVTIQGKCLGAALPDAATMNGYFLAVQY